MKKIIYCIFILVSLTSVSCGNKTVNNDKDNDSLSSKARAKGDSTLYGLACEGCTDSVLVFLPFDGGDPVTFDIIEAAKKKRIIGKPETGDWVGVMLNADDGKKADMVIDLDQLKGTWVYMAMPKLRERKNNNTNVYVDRHEEDSILKTLLVPREQGFALKRNSMAEPVGAGFRNVTGKQSPVIYPEVKIYTDWSIFNGKLVLSGKGMKTSGTKGNVREKAVSDTAEFVFMMKDSLQLRFKDGVKGYYRK